MAGDWIPYTKDLPEKLEVARISAATGRSIHEVVALLLRFWAWADGQSEDGKLPGLDVTLLSRLQRDTDVTFWHALKNTGWIVETDHGIEIPNFDVWMGRSGKKRLNATRRQRQSRSSLTLCHADVTNECDKSVTDVTNECDKSVTTEQNRTEQDKENPPLSPKGEKRFAAASMLLPQSLDTPAFREAWQQWCSHRSKKRQGLKEHTAKLQLDELAAMGLDRAVAAIMFSIRQGYTGIFEEKKSGPGQSVGPSGRVIPPKGKFADRNDLDLFGGQDAEKAADSPPPQG